MVRGCTKTTAKLAIGHALEQWSGYCQRYSPRTRLIYASLLTEFVHYAHPQTIQDIQPPELQTFINSLLSHHAHTSVNTYIIALKSFCRWLCDTYGLPNVSAKLRKLPDNKGESRCLSDEEYRKVLTIAGSDDYHIIRFLCNTGLRITEFIGIKPSDLTGKWLVVRTKGRKINHIPLNNAALDSISHIMDMSKSARTISRHCHELAQKAGIPRFSPHACRHYFATQLLSKGVSIHHVSKLLSHSSVTITEKIYWHFRHTDLVGLTDCLDL